MMIKEQSSGAGAPVGSGEALPGMDAASAAARCSRYDRELHWLVGDFRDSQQRLYRLCLRHLRDPAAAQDAVQEAFVRAAPYIRGLSVRAADAYLRTVARHVCVDELRLRQRRDRTAHELGLVAPVLDPERAAVDRRFIGSIWERMSHRDRALILHQAAGYSCEETAQRMGMSRGSVSMGLVRARHRARRLLEGLGAVVAAPLLRWRHRSLVRRQRAHLRRSIQATDPGIRHSHAMTLFLAGSVTTLFGMAYGVHVERDAPASGAPVALEPPGVGVALDHMQITAVTVAPGPQGAGGVVFASGARAGGCAGSDCHVLFRSDAPGRWTELPASGFVGGSVVVSPTYPADRTFFVSGNAGLQQSDDGGATFRTVAPLAANAVVVSDATPGDAVVLIGAQPTWLYHVHTAALSPGPVLPVGLISIDGLALVPGTHTVVATARQLDPNPPHAIRSVVLRCDMTVCRVVFATTEDPWLHLAAAQPSRTGHPVVAYSSHRIVVSGDGGRTFTAMPRIARSVQAVAEADAEVGLVVATASGTSGAVLRSVDSGHTFVPVATSAPAVTAETLTVLPDGRLLVALALADATGRWGMRCSSDGGESWHAGC